MKLRTLIIAAAAGLSFGVAAQDWQPLPAGQKLVVLADGSSVHRNGVAATLRVLESYAHRQTIGDDAYPHRSRTVDYLFNCVDHTYARTGWTLFERALGQGGVVWQRTVDAPDFVAIAAGSEGADLLDAACGPTALAGSPAVRAN